MMEVERMEEEVVQRQEGEEAEQKVHVDQAVERKVAQQFLVLLSVELPLAARPTWLELPISLALLTSPALRHLSQLDDLLYFVEVMYVCLHCIALAVD